MYPADRQENAVWNRPPRELAGVQLLFERSEFRIPSEAHVLGLAQIVCVCVCVCVCVFALTWF